MALKRLRNKRKKGMKMSKKGSKQLPVGLGTLYTGVPNTSYNAER